MPIAFEGSAYLSCRKHLFCGHVCKIILVKLPGADLKILLQKPLAVPCDSTPRLILTDQVPDVFAGSITLPCIACASTY